MIQLSGQVPVTLGRFLLGEEVIGSVCLKLHPERRAGHALDAPYEFRASYSPVSAQHE
jgi:hypothetical protein